MKSGMCGTDGNSRGCDLCEYELLLFVGWVV